MGQPWHGHWSRWSVTNGQRLGGPGDMGKRRVWGDRTSRWSIILFCIWAVLFFLGAFVAGLISLQ